MAGFQVGIFGLLSIYGLASLGSRMVCLGTTMVVFYAVAVWFTLHRPWDFSWSPAGEGPLQRGWVSYVWDPGLIVGLTLWVANAHRSLIADARAQLERMQSEPFYEVFHSDARAWEADTLGTLVISGPSFVGAVVLPSMVLGLLWFFLPK